MATSRPVILGIDEDRAAQGLVAQTFNAHGLFYRFITDRRKVAGGVKQLKPDLLVVFGELASDFVIQVLDALAQDVAHAQLPVVVVCADTSDTPFVAGLRSGVVSLLARPFDAQHVALVKATYEELRGRRGAVSGPVSAGVVTRLLDHVRRTRRTGVLTIDARTANEGRASFVNGKLQRATFLNALGADAVKAMAGRASGQWTFSEVAGQHGEGAGVVIEVGASEDDVTELEGVEVVTGVPEDEPLAFEVAVPRAAPPPSAGPAPVHQTAIGPPIRLLLVDDDEAIVRMLGTLFKKHQFEVVSAFDGQQGAEAAFSQSFDVVLADLNMPRLDGWGMLRLLRDDFRTRELPVAFISAHDDYRESLRALNAGAQAYLSKGTRLENIVSQVKKLLEPREAAARDLTSGQPASIPLSLVGPQWIVRQISQKGLSGALDAKDGWATYRLAFASGTCLNARATAGKFTAESDRAFNAFVATRNAEGTWTPGPVSAPPNLHAPTAELLERACATLNENERALRDQLLLTATRVEVNADLYAVYQQVGPKQWLEAARLICEEKVSPREVIARLDMSPVDIEETMKDLIRRGVLTLRKA